MSDSFGLAITTGIHDLQRTRDEQAIRDLQTPSGDSAKIGQSARAFESLLIGKWLEAAEESLATVPGGDPMEEQDHGALHQFSALGMQSLAESLSADGGLGIAKLLTRSLEHVSR